MKKYTLITKLRLAVLASILIAESKHLFGVPTVGLSNRVGAAGTRSIRHRNQPKLRRMARNRR